MTLGLTNGVVNAALAFTYGSSYFLPASHGYNIPVATVAVGGGDGSSTGTYGVTTDSRYSGIICDYSSLNSFSPMFAIKY